VAGLEAEVIADRRTPLDVVREKAERLKDRQDVGRDIFMKAVDVCWKDKSLRVWPRAEFEAWLDSSSGLVWSFLHKLYLSGKRAFKSMKKTVEFVKKCTKNELREFARRRDQVNGTDILSALEWPASDGEGSGRFMLWKRAMRYMATEYGWGPEQVSKLTMWQLKLYTADESQLGGVSRMAPGEFKAGARRNPFEKRTKDHAARRHVRKMLAEQQAGKKNVALRDSSQRRRPQSAVRA
jgi:hypothetical protein